MASGKTVSSEDEELLGDQPRPQELSFLQALLAVFGPSFLISMCFLLLQDLLSFVSPQLLRSPTYFLAASLPCAGQSVGCP